MAHPNPQLQDLCQARQQVGFFSVIQCINTANLFLLLVSTIANAHLY